MSSFLFRNAITKRNWIYIYIYIFKANHFPRNLPWMAMNGSFPFRHALLFRCDAVLCAMYSTQCIRQSAWIAQMAQIAYLWAMFVCLWAVGVLTADITVHGHDNMIDAIFSNFLEDFSILHKSSIINNNFSCILINAFSTRPRIQFARVRIRSPCRYHRFSTFYVAAHLLGTSFVEKVNLLEHFATFHFSHRFGVLFIFLFFISFRCVCVLQLLANSVGSSIDFRGCEQNSASILCMECLHIIFHQRVLILMTVFHIRGLTWDHRHWWTFSILGGWENLNFLRSLKNVSL